MFLAVVGDESGRAGGGGGVLFDVGGSTGLGGSGTEAACPAPQAASRTATPWKPRTIRVHESAAQAVILDAPHVHTVLYAAAQVALCTPSRIRLPAPAAQHQHDARGGSVLALHA